MGIVELLLILALVAFILAALGVPTRNVQLGWLGMALVTLVFILEGRAF